VTSKPDFKVMVLLLVFMQLTRDLFAIAKFLYVFYRQDLPQAALPYCFYSRTGFGVFRPAGATRCTDQDEIWQGGADQIPP